MKKKENSSIFDHNYLQNDLVIFAFKIEHYVIDRPRSRRRGRLKIIHQNDLSEKLPTTVKPGWD